jgi:hypothetical protein
MRLTASATAPAQSAAVVAHPGIVFHGTGFFQSVSRTHLAAHPHPSSSLWKENYFFFRKKEIERKELPVKKSRKKYRFYSYMLSVLFRKKILFPTIIHGNTQTTKKA